MLMATTLSRLGDVLNRGYLKPLAALKQFHLHCGEDNQLLKLAKAEQQRLTELNVLCNLNLESRCFVSKQHLHTLNAVLSAPKPEEDMPSKLKALAGLAKGTVDDVEKQAEAALNKLNQAAAKAQDGVGKVNNVAAEIEKSAADLNDFAAQTSNFPIEE